MNKEIYFCLDVDSYEKERPTFWKTTTYGFTEMAIRKGVDCIVTTSIEHLSFDLIPHEYDIYLCYEEKEVKINRNMDLSDIVDACRKRKYFKLFQLLGINGENDGKNGIG